MIDRIVLATDGSASVERAIAVAIDLADRFDAEMHVLYVIDEGEVNAAPASVREDLQAGLADQAKAAFEAVQDATAQAVTTAVRTGHPENEIITYAKDHEADIVAIGTRGRHGEHRFLLGSVAEAVVRRCPIPVLSVRQLTGGPARS